MEPIIIIGLTPQGLFLLREFGKMGYPVYALAKKDDVGIYSRFGEKIIIESQKDIIQNIEKIQNSTKIYDKNPRYYIAGGFFLKEILECHPDLFNRLDIIPSPLNALNILTKKTALYSLANDLGIISPHTETIFNISNNKNFHESFSFPLIVKWNEAPTDFIPIKKIWVVKDYDELIKIKKNINKSYEQKLIVQQFIGQSFESSISYGGYFVQGKEKAGITVKQIRQYPSGLSSYVEEYSDRFANQARDQAICIIKKLNFSGFCEFEYRICEEIEKLYLIETNPRPWGWIKILKQKYPQFDELLKYPNDISPLSSMNNNCKWFNIQRDFSGILNTFSKNKNIIGLLNAINSYRSQKIFDLLDFNDFHPFFSQAKKAFILIVNKDNNKNVEVM